MRMPTRQTSWVLAVLFSAACGSRSSAPNAPTAAAESARPAAGVSVARTPPPSTPSTPSVPESAVAPAPVFPARFTRELAEPVSDVALDRPPHVAALARDAVHFRNRQGWQRQALPAVAAAPSAELRVFYGRDYRVRVVGATTDERGPRAVYLRSMPAGLERAPYELGRLGGERGALLAVLGTADPELVCRPADTCLVKRTSGWTTLDAPDGLSHLAISGGRGWVLAGRQLRSAERGWPPTGPEGPFERAADLFALGERVFVLDAERPLVHVLEGNVYRSLASPVGLPKSLWGVRLEALWLAGDAGLAFFDGKGFRLVASAPEGVTRVLGRDADDVWFASRSGLYRLVTDRDPVQAPVEP